MKRLLLSAMSIMLVACDANTEAAPARPDFRAALDAHLAAIAAKDIDAFTPTITKRDDLRVIFPDGSGIDTTQGVIDFHTEWFMDSAWRMDAEIVKVIEGEDVSAALLKYDYRDTPEGEPRAAWLALVFQLEDGEWRLIHDQNTRITQSATIESE